MTGPDLGSAPAEVAAPPPPQRPRERQRRPFYPRLLRLRHIHPNGWQRAFLGEGVVVLAALLALADLATAWTLLVLPVAVAVVVKAHDVLAGYLARQPETGSVSEPGIPATRTAPNP
jgi:hypothetical protein